MDKLGGKHGHHIIAVIINFVTIVFFCVLLYTSAQTTVNMVGKFSTAAHIPLVIPYAALPTGCVMSILRLIELSGLEIKKMRAEKNGVQ